MSMEILLFVTHICYSRSNMSGYYRYIVISSLVRQGHCSGKVIAIGSSSSSSSPIVFPFVALSITSLALSPDVFPVSLDCICPSYFRSSSLHFPWYIRTKHFLNVCSSSLLVTCPYQFDIPSVIFLEACTTLVVPRKCSFLILSLRVTPYIQHSLLVSFTSILFSCRSVVANVSPP